LTGSQGSSNLRGQSIDLLGPNDRREKLELKDYSQESTTQIRLEK
jgi:hypothetical protein